LFHLSVRINLRLGEDIRAVLTEAEHRAHIADFTTTSVDGTSRTRSSVSASATW
jgi:hypothetical protein